MNTRNTTTARIFRRLKREADFTLRAILSASILALPATGLRADAPVGTVVSGEASFDYNGNKTTITAGNNAIIEYPKFNIDRNETVQFVQPTDTSRVLNRITGGDPSSILGSLQANGIVYFVNPAGIYFGQHATIDVGQFYAAAGNLSNANFLAGRDNFERLSGQVHNEGVINASAIHLIGQNVRNTGNLNSPAGLVMLAAGDDVLIGRRGEHVFVNATKTTPDAASATAGVENAGNINAEGGRALLAAGDLYALAVQNSGVIKARNVELAGQGSGEVWNRGAIDAASADTEGGRVEITGQYIGIDENAIIDASGAHGGGEVLIGGDYQGANAGIRNATATYVAEGAAIRADATTSGSGGKVIVWADETTRFHGSISATGFTSGGFAEVSGKQNLLYTGLADLRSADGSAGTLLLDPDNLTISTAASTPGVIPGSVFTAPVSDTDWNLNTSDLVTQLELANVTVQTLTGNITVADAIAWTNPYSLTLNSGSDILINSPITADAGDLILLAARDTILSGAGAVNVGGIFSATSRFFESASLENTITAGGDISIATPQATGNVSIGGTMISNAGDINISTIGLSICAPLITNSGDGDITLGSGAHGGTTISEAGLINSGGKFTANGSTFTTSSATNTITAGGDIYIRAFYVLTGYIHIGGTVTSTGGGITTESYSETVISAPLIADIGGTNGVSVAVACGSLTVGDVTSGGAQTYTISGDQGRYIAAATITGTGLLKTTSAAAGNITISSGSGSSFLTDGGRIESARNFTVTVDTADFSTAAANTITAGGDISITATAGNITLASNITAGTAGSGAITLASTNGDLSLAGITATSNGDQAYTAAGSLILPSVINTGTGGILANTSGDLTLESIISGKSFSFSGSNIYVTNTLATTNAADGDIALNATGTITLVDGPTTDGLINAAGAFSATSAFFLSENAANTITTGGAISIRSANVSLEGNVSSATGGITVKAGSSFRSTGTIFSDISGTHGVSIDGGFGGWGYLELGDVISGGSQTYNAGGTIDIKGLLKTYNAGTGDITIENNSEILLNNLGSIASAGKITVRADGEFVTQTAANTISAMGDIAISGASIALGGGLTAVTGSITLLSIHSSLSSDSDITAGGNITIDGRSGITLNGALTSSTGAIAINNIEGAITLGNAITAATDISIATTYNGSITLGNAITAGNDISIATTYDITVNGNLTSGTAGSGAITLTSTNGDLSLSGITATSNGDQSYSAGGSLILPSVINTGTGGVSAATTGDLTLESITSGKSFSFSGSNIYVTNTLATTNADDGDITLLATGTITLVHDVTTDGLINAAATFTSTSASFVSQDAANTITAGGGISISATDGSISLVGDLAVTSGAVSISTLYGGITLGNVTSDGAQNYYTNSFTGTGLLQTTNATTGDINIIADIGSIIIKDGGRVNAAAAFSATNAGFHTETADNTITAGGDISINTPQSELTVSIGGTMISNAGNISIDTANLRIKAPLITNSATGDIALGSNYQGFAEILVTDDGRIDAAGVFSSTSLSNFTTGTSANTITAASISITAGGDGIELAGDITSTTGDISLASTSGNIYIGRSGDGSIDSAGTFSATANGNFITETAANTITAGGNIGILIDIDGVAAMGDILLNGALISTGGNVNLRAHERDITSNAQITADTGGLTANTGMGTITLGNVTTANAQNYSAGIFTGTGMLRSTDISQGNIGIITTIIPDGRIILTGLGSVNSAAAFSATASSAFTASGAANTITANDISITIYNGSIGIAGDITSTAGDITLNAKYGDILVTTDGLINAAAKFTSTSASFVSQDAANTITAAKGIAITSTASTGGIMFAGDLLSNAGDITLASSGSIVSTAGITAAGSISATASSNIILVNATSGDSQDYTSTVGSITHTGTISTVGATFRAPGGLTLGRLISGSNVSLTAGFITLNDLLQTSSASAGGITLDATNGKILVTGDGRIDAATVFSATSRVDGFTTETVANTITAGTGINITTGGAAGLVLNGDLESTAGNITLVSSGSLVSTAAITAAAGALTATSGSDMTLRDVTTGGAQTYTYYNIFTATSGTLRATGADSDIVISQMIKAAGQNDEYTGDILIKDVNATGAFSATSGRFTLLEGGTIAATGDVSISNPVPGGYTYATAWYTNVHGTIDSSAGSVSLISGRGGLNLSGTITSSGAQYYESWRTVAPGTFITSDTDTGDITFNYNGSWGGPAISFETTTIVDAARDIKLHYPPNAGAHSGTITLPAGAVFNAANAITIDTTAVSFVSLLADLNSGAGGIKVNTSGTLILANAATTGTQSFTAGNITLTGTLGGSGNLTLASTTGSIALTGDDALIDMGGDITVTAASTFTTAAAANTITSGTNIAITAGTGITINGNLTAASAGDAGAITLTSNAGDISLIKVTATSNGDQTYTAAGSILLTDILDAGAGSITANAGGDLTLPTITADSSLSFTGSNIYITGTLETTNATDGDITLVGTGTTIMVHTSTTNGLIDAAGAFTSTSASFLSENAANTITTAGPVSIKAASSSIALNGALTSGSTISLTAQNGITSGSLATITADGSITMRNANAHIILYGDMESASGGINLQSRAQVFLRGDVKSGVTGTDGIRVESSIASIETKNVLTGGAQTYVIKGSDRWYFKANGALTSLDAATGDITIIARPSEGVTFSGSSKVNAAGKFTSTMGGAFTTVGAANTITAGGLITISSTSIALNGAVFNDAGILLTANNGSITTTAQITATTGNVIMNAGAGSITANAGILSGGTQSYTAGSLTVSGQLRTTSAATGDIVISTTGATLLTGDNQIDAARSFTANARELTTASAANTIAAAADITITTTDDITINGNLTAASTGDAGAITLTSSAGDISLIKVTATSNGDQTYTAAGSILLTDILDAGAGSITATAGGDLTLPTITAGNDLRFTAGNNIHVVGTLATTNAAADITLAAAGTTTLVHTATTNGLVDAAGKFTSTSAAFLSETAANTITTVGDITITATSNAGIAIYGDILSTAGSLLTDSYGNTTVNASVTTSGSQVYETMRGTGGITITGTLATTNASDGDIRLLSHNTATLSGDALINADGAVYVDALTLVTAGSANTITAGKWISVHATAATGDAVTLNGALTAINDNIQIVTAGGNITANATLTADTSAVELNAGSNGNITVGNVLTGGTQAYAGGSFTGTGLLKTAYANDGDIVINTTGAALITGDDARVESAAQLTATAGSFTTSSTTNTLNAVGDITIATLNDIALNGNLDTSAALTLTSTAGNIALTDITATSNGDQTHTAAGSILLSNTLNAGSGSITANAGGALTVVNATGSSAIALTGSQITLTGLLATSNAADGAITLNATDAGITLADSGAINSAATLSATANGTFLSTAAANTITAAGNIGITIAQDGLGAKGDILLNGALTSTAGGITLNAHERNITATAQITADTTGAGGITAYAGWGDITLAGVLTGGAQNYFSAGFTGTGHLQTTNATHGNINIDARGILITEAGGQITAANSLNATASLGGFTTSSTANTITAGNAITIATANDIQLHGAATAVNDIKLTSTTGDILSTARLTSSAAGLAATANNGDITLGNAQTSGTQIYAATTLTGTGLLKTTDAATGDIIINTTGATLLTGDDGAVDSARDINMAADTLTTAAVANTLAAARDIAITTTDDITINGNLTAASTGGPGAITLTSAAGDISLIKVTATSNGDQTYTAAGSILLTDILDAGAGSITANAGGDLTLATIIADNALSFTGSNITITGTLETTNAIGGDITLVGTGSTIMVHTGTTNGLINAAAAFTSTSAVFASNSAANTINAGGPVKIEATTDDIVLNGALTSGSAIMIVSQTGITSGSLATIIAAGSIVMSNPLGHIILNGDMESASGGINLWSKNDVLLRGDVKSGVTGTDGIRVESSVASIETKNVLTGGAQTYVINGSEGRHFNATGTLTSLDAATGDITIITPPSENTTFTESGNVNAAGKFTHTGGMFLTEGAANTINAGGLISISATSIALNGAVFNDTDIHLTADGGAIATTAQITATTGNVIMNAGAGDITTAGVLSGGTQSYAGGSFTGTGLLKTTNTATGDIVIATTGATLITGDDGAVDSARDINMAADTLTTAAAANTLAAGRDITLAANNDITIQGDITAAANAGHGAITMTSTAGNIALLHITATSNGDQAYTAALDITLTDLINTGSGSLLADAGGLLTLHSVITGGTLALTGSSLLVTGTLRTTNPARGSIALTATGADITFTDAGSIISADTFTGTAKGNFLATTVSNTLAVASTLSIAAEAGMELHGTVNAGNAITLASAEGDILSTAQITSANAGLAATANNGAITIGNVTTTSAQTYTSLLLTGTGLLKTTNASTGDILINVTDTVLLTGQGAINSAGVITGTVGAITADGAANTLTAAKNINLTAANDISLAGDLASASGNILVNTIDGGSITLTNHLSTPSGEIKLTTTGTGAITLHNATSSGNQTHATEGGNINVTGTLAIGSGATMRFSTTSTTDTGTTVIDADAALVVPNTTLLVQGGMFLDENGRISAPVGIDIQGAGAGVTFNAALGGAGNPLATINIAGAGAIDINGGVETTGAQTYNTDGGDINITSLLRATDNGAAISFDTHNPSGTTGMTTVHTGGIQTNNTTVTSTGGLTLAADTTFDAGGGSLYIDGQGRAASLGIDLELPQINILNAGDIHLSGVTTTGNQYYHFDDGAAMRLTGTLLATGNGSSITIENTRTDHAEWATIFAVGGNGIHIETLNGDITISKYNTLLSYDPDNGAASPTAGDIYIRAWNGLATVPDISASHQVDLIALAITLNGTLYQSGGISILGMDGAPINSAFLTLDEPSVNIVAIKSRSLYPPLVGINSYAYLPSLYDEVTLRVTTDFFNTDTPPPAGSIFNEIYSSDFRSWMYLYTELVQVNIAANTFDKSLELSAVEENMRKATAGYLASNDAANRITGATKEHLYNVGIFARGATDAERLSQHHYRGLFQQIIPSEIPSPEHRKVVDGRISETSARETVALYQETFMTIDDDGRPVSRTSEILAALTATYNAYRATTATPGPVGFGLYIDDNAATNTDAAVSQKFVRSLRTLFAAIERIGLTRTEVAVAKSVLLRPLRSPAIPGATLRGLIEPDTILASAPPAGAPKITANF
ncbi:filamentous hemagglutinin family protein [Ereboglobus sp. PH5-5]|uniref:two-partner secretion domain-containing protein n=1 Tax=Ereboglobus sp. PH5-5 TaxID=2940529 RepID=UPI0024050B1A|nr:filamentous hemagglutinin N-terminal domain-containing protein [Ereboglobus sp. PH5-5]MDF9832737.1 filamentous hemagglutinin family protein [Ereboglobus sp. PH5-5]